MKYILLISAIILSNLHCVYAQDEVRIDATLNKVVSASISGNTQKLLEGTSPRLLEAMGGKEQALKLFKETYEKLASQGIKIDTVYNYHEREISFINGIKYCFIPQLIVMSIPDSQKKMINYTTVLALLEKGSSEWTLIDYNQLDDKQAKILLPEFKDVVFPRNREIKPLVIPKEELEKNIAYLMDVMDKSIQTRKELMQNQ